MKEIPAQYCDCCGLPVGSETGEDCPRCHYPISASKEEQFLEATIRDLRRVADHGGAHLTIVDLIYRYQTRLANLRRARVMTAFVTPPVPAIKTTIRAIPTNPFAPPVSPQRALTPSPQSAPEAAVTPSAVGENIPGRMFSWKSFFTDQAINIVASLGAFLILIGALSFIATTPNLLLAFFVVLIVHAVFGITGIGTYRFATFRLVATIYTIIFALLVPLVGFSAYRLIAGNLLALSVPVLIALAATYTAIVYIILAIYQRFTPFAYLGMVALIIADLAMAEAFKLGYWWWPDMLMLLAFPLLIAVARRAGTTSPFINRWGVLLEPMRILMYMVVFAGSLGLIVTLCYSFQLDITGNPLREVRIAIFSMVLLLLCWTCLFIWRTQKTQTVFVVAYLFFACVLAMCYTIDFQPIGYALVLAGVALLYHGVNRFARRFIQSFGTLRLHLDLMAIVLVFLVPFIGSPLVPVQLFATVYLPTVSPALLLHFQAGWQTWAELIALASGILLTISITFYHAGASRTPLRPAWCWLLLLSGFLLNWAYSIVVLATGIIPVWSFLGLALVLVASAVVVRRIFAVAWANPLDVLALTGIVFTLGLSLNMNTDSISALLMLFAALTYSVLLYQRRRNELFLSFILAFAAFPALLNHPLVMLLLSIVLPLASVVIHRLLHQSSGTATRQVHTGVQGTLQLAEMWEWPLLVVGLVYGAGISVYDSMLSQSTVHNVFGVMFPVALELALLSLTWYGSAAAARMKLWLLPAIGFAIAAVLIPSNNFWVLAILTPITVLLAIGCRRFADRDWALPLYIVALLAALMTGYTGFVQDHWAATALVLLGFAALAYIVGVVEQLPVALWLAPVFATWSVIDAASLLGDLYRPPTVAILCAALGVSIRFLPFLPYTGTGQSQISQGSQGSRRWFSSHLDYALPFYATALAAAVLTGVYGTLASINRPFYGAIPDALLVYAMIAFIVLIFEYQPRWQWLVVGFALWGTLLAIQLTAYYLAGIGIGAAFVGLLAGRFLPRIPRIPRTAIQTPLSPARLALQAYTWSWPWYITALVAAIATGVWTALPVHQPLPGFPAYSLLAFTVIALVVMVVERAPEMLVFPAGLAAWAIWLWQPPLHIALMMMIYTLLCVLIFATQVIWRVISPATSRLSATELPTLFGMGGQVLVILFIIGQGGLFADADAGHLVHVGAGSLLVLAILLFCSGRLHAHTVTQMHGLESDTGLRARRLQHWCDLATGLLFSLVISWELSAFHQARLDILTLAPASYLLVIAPIVMRDQILAQRHRAGQIIAIAGAFLLLLPVLWFSFSDSNLLPTLLLMGEAMALLLLGIATRIRVFVLSSISLIMVGTLHVLFLSTSSALALMAIGGLLIAIAAALILARHRLQILWTQWE